MLTKEDEIELARLVTNYKVGKKCSSGSLKDFQTQIKAIVDKLTPDEIQNIASSARWGSVLGETMMSARLIITDTIQ